MKRQQLIKNEGLAMRCWVEANLQASTATMSKRAAQRWLDLLTADRTLFFQLALLGFVTLRRNQNRDDAFPEDEFNAFLAEFIRKVEVVVEGKGKVFSIPLFAHVGEARMINMLGLRTVKNA